MNKPFKKDTQYYKFCLYGFLKNQRFFEPFLIIIFLREKGLSFTEIGTLYSIRFILRTLMEIPSGFAADAMGRKGTMLFSYTFYILSFALYYVADTFLWLILPSAIFAIGDAFRTGTHKAMIFEYLKKNGWADQKVTYYGHTRSWSQFGSAISSLLAAGLILLNKNYELIFLYSLIPYALGFILLASYPAWLNGASLSTGDLKAMLQGIREIISESVQALKNRECIRLNFNVASFSGFYQASKDYLQIMLMTAVISVPFLTTIDRPEDEKEIVFIGVVYFILYLLTAFAARISGKLHRYFNSDARFLNILLITGLLISLGAGLSHQYNLYIPAIILFLSILFIENIRRPAGVGIIADRFDSRILASILSVESQLSSILSAVFSFIIGLTADLWGFGYALVICSVMVLLLVPVLQIKK
ncbi:MAG: MFS transporter [Bacteroidales bacterium]|nr:MFS transporter [Bacteroidales bacterium]